MKASQVSEGYNHSHLHDMLEKLDQVTQMLQ